MKKIAGLQGLAEYCGHRPARPSRKKKPKTQKITDLKPNPHHGENWGHKFARPCSQALEACKGLAQACQALAATSGFRSLQPHRPTRPLSWHCSQALEACKGLAQACQALAATSGFRSLQPHRPTRPLSWHVGKVVGESSK